MAAAVRGRISEDTPWEAPSVEEARSFEKAIHPRHPEGGKFKTIESKTGRYCFLGGCGEQLDLWDEVSRGDAGIDSLFWSWKQRIGREVPYSLQSVLIKREP